MPESPVRTLAALPVSVGRGSEDVLAAVPSTPYDAAFYQHQQDGSLQSAREIVPHIIQLAAPASVVDVGCGVGAWLRVFQEHGVGTIAGVDGDWVDEAMLQIPRAAFQRADLSRPFQVAGQFDVAISLEVAEHLPPESAAGFVASLTALAPIVVFSAAIPFQGGVEHKNEQWPDYWAALFANHRYVAVDCLRSRVWKNDNAQFWYAQNMMVFVREDRLGSIRDPEARPNDRASSMLSIVHPKKYLQLAALYQEALERSDQLPVSQLLRALPRAMLRAATRRISR